MTAKYFSALNYTLANEDSRLEMAILPSHARRVIAVAGSGARVLPLLAKSPSELVCVDLSADQLLLTELRISTAAELNRGEFLKFWGYPPDDGDRDFRRQVLDDVGMSPACREFAARYYTAAGWNSLLYCGRWERTFAKIAKMCAFLLGKDAKDFFASNSQAEHDAFMRERFPKLRWNLLLAGIGNSLFFNSLLYGGHFPKKNVQDSHYRYYKIAFDRLFRQGIPRENFFLQMTLLGGVVFPEGNPVECQDGIYESIQRGIKNCKISYAKENLLDFVSAQRANPADFISLSDVPSYFDDQTATNFLQDIRQGISTHAIVVVRYYLRVIDWMLTDGFMRVTEYYQAQIDGEKTQMYHIDVFKKGPS